MKPSPLQEKENHGLELFFMGFILACLFPTFLVGVCWMQRTCYPTFGNWGDLILIGAVTIGLCQWVYILPATWFAQRYRRHGLFWGLWSGSIVVFLANALYVAYYIVQFRRFN